MSLFPKAGRTTFRQSRKFGQLREPNSRGLGQRQPAAD
jgi:hypothetical protein